MNKNIRRFVESSDAKVVIFDIDGTLKDLCKEHTNAVQCTLERFEVSGFKRRAILALNKLAMYIVKTGFIPTNSSKQNFLVKVYAILCGVKIVDFYEAYFESYTREICLFDGVSGLVKSLNCESEVYFATINKQNYNLEACGISQERISYTERAFKVATYNRIIKSTGIPKKDIVIVGDNVFDDLVSAKQLGVKCFLVNRYKSRLKSLVCKLVNSRYLK